MQTLVAWKLRQIMADRRIGSKELAEAIGVHENTIGRWRKADEMPKVSGREIDLICSTLGCTLDELLGRTRND